MNAIEISNLSRCFGKKYAVKELNMHVEESAIYGFIGENGAGKSTTQKMICGLMNPTEGNISLYGKSINDKEARSKIGLLIEQPAIFPEMTAYENMIMQAYNVGLNNPDTKIKELLEKVGLDNTGKKKSKNFSLGMKQRLAIAQSLLGNPTLLILDEPMNGLDPEGIRDIRNTLQRLNTEEKITILISSHILGELSKISSHYGIIKDGTMVQEISAKELYEQCKDYMFIRVDHAENVMSMLKEKMPNYEYELCNSEEIRIYGTEESLSFSKVLVEKSIAVKEISFQRTNLEDYFLTVMGGGRNA